MNDSQIVRRMTDSATAKRLCKLVILWTRAEVASRVSPIDTSLAGDLFQEKLQYEDRIRKLLFGETNLYALADLLGIPTNARRGRIRWIKGEGSYNLPSRWI